MSKQIHVALLRGINVGGKNKLPMKPLIELFVEAGCTNVASYIQSGNVVLGAASALARQLPTLIQTAIGKRFGLNVPVILVSANELSHIAADNPFLKAKIELDVLHLGLLAKEPSAGQAAGLDENRSPPDAFVLRGRALYFHLPNGIARTKLTNAYFDRALDTTCTIRNWRTVQKLVELCAPNR